MGRKKSGAESAATGETLSPRYPNIPVTGKDDTTAFPKLQATIEASANYYLCKLTRNGKFVSATTHATEQSARNYAKKKRAEIIEK